jgi:hypothetical protein
MCFKRAGASGVITCFAENAAEIAGVTLAFYFPYSSRAPTNSAITPIIPQ